MTTETPTLTTIRIAHSPDSDDAFMFYALTQGLLDVEGLEIRHVLQDIESLNQAAFQGTYEITALSFHGYAHLADRYQLMPSGASFGDGYGPIVVSRSHLGHSDLPGLKIAIPGELTTAHLALRLWQPDVTTKIVPFDKILDVVQSGEVGVGVEGEGGDLVRPLEGGLVQALEVQEDVADLQPLDGENPLSQGIEHEGIVRIGAVGDADGRRGRLRGHGPGGYQNRGRPRPGRALGSRHPRRTVSRAHFLSLPATLLFSAFTDVARALYI